MSATNSEPYGLSIPYVGMRNRVFYSTGFLDLLRVFIEGKGGKVFRSWKHNFKHGIHYCYTCRLLRDNVNEILRYLKSMDVDYEMEDLSDEQKDTLEEVSFNVLLFAKHNGENPLRDI